MAVAISDGVTEGPQGTNPSDTVSITVTPVNDAPTLTATATNPTYVENSARVTLFSAAAASTIEAGQTITSMTLTVAGLHDGANELLFIDGSNVALTNGNSIVTATNGLTVNISVTGNTATATFTGANLSESAFQALVDALGYRVTGTAPTTGNRTVTITEIVNSGSNTSPDDNTAAVNIASTVAVTATTLKVTATEDYSDGNPVVSPGITSILFDTTGNATATFGANQFSLFGPIANPLAVTGDGFNNIIRVNLAVAGTFSAAGWAFTNWSASDRVILTGSAGADVLAGTAFNDTLDGGGGTDTADYSSATQAVVVDLPGHIALGAQIGTDTLSSIENVRTGSGNDAVAGNGATNVLDGGAGIDTVSYYAVSSGVVLDLAGQTGVDGTSTDTLLNFENANGTAYNDAISGTAAANVLNGLGGIDTISYYLSTQGVLIDLAGNVAIQGGITDTILNFENANGSAFNDAISGNAGANVLDGLGGIDTLSYYASPRGLMIDLASTVVVDGAVTDIVRNFENVNATNQNDAVSGNAAANVLNGLGGTDTISYYASAQGSDDQPLGRHRGFGRRYRHAAQLRERKRLRICR